MSRALACQTIGTRAPSDPAKGAKGLVFDSKMAGINDRLLKRKAQAEYSALDSGVRYANNGYIVN